MWPPVSIGNDRYMDGGIRSSDNADLAAGCGRIVVMSPLGTGGMTLPGSGGLAEQVDGLRSSGSQVLVIEPDDASRKAIGHNPLSPNARIPAAQAGRVQGRTEADRIAATYS